MNRHFSFFLLITLLIITTYQSKAANQYGIRKVVIDAGHGGHDPGCVNKNTKNTKEKDIALIIAKKLGNYITQNFSDVEVIYTRDDDSFVELYRRAQIANENKADLFISIHCNANPKKSSYGTETYVMGLHKSEANLEVAKQENASILFEDNYSQKYEGFDPHSPEANIIFSLYQNAFLDQSLNFASKVQYQFREKLGRLDRGVKQAGFLVLFKTTMPSVLIETGFLSNTEEEAYLTSAQGQDYIASGIFRAFKQYKAEIEANEVKNITNHARGEKKVKEKITDKKKIKNEDTTITKINSDSNKLAIKKEPDNILIKDTSSKKYNYPNKQKELHQLQNEEAHLNVYYSVQIASSPEKLNIKSKKFKGIENIKEYKDTDGLYKYAVGNKRVIKEILEMQKEMIGKGFKGSFVVAFMDDKRIGIDEANRLINNNK
ncbi:MAG: N-acetylmuramoyl-L-alanine amidase [Bacteroidota bacterium]|nr:N-acetylmuramoyl-L-alanine amidase [Bacteroidota bacterium]